jgi:hypothetical protein
MRPKNRGGPNRQASTAPTLARPLGPNKLDHPHRIWWALPGSNRRPVACKTTALPTELNARRSPPEIEMPGWPGLPFRARHPEARSDHPSCAGKLYSTHDVGTAGCTALGDRRRYLSPKSPTRRSNHPKRSIVGRCHRRADARVARVLVDGQTLAARSSARSSGVAAATGHRRESSSTMRSLPKYSPTAAPASRHSSIPPR